MVFEAVQPVRVTPMEAFQKRAKAGTFHANQCRDYGTQVVGAVKPGKGGTTQDGYPLFNTVAEAVRQTGANASLVFVPASGAADAIMEAAAAVESFTSPRSWSFAMLGIHEYLKAFPGDLRMQRLLQSLGQRLMGEFGAP